MIALLFSILTVQAASVDCVGKIQDEEVQGTVFFESFTKENQDFIRITGVTETPGEEFETIILTVESRKPNRIGDVVYKGTIVSPAYLAQFEMKYTLKVPKIKSNRARFVMADAADEPWMLSCK